MTFLKDLIEDFIESFATLPKPCFQTSLKIAEVVTKSTRKKFAQSWVFNILKRDRECTISPNEDIIRHNICNVELQQSINYV